MIKRQATAFRRNPTMVANPSKRSKARRKSRHNPAGTAHRRKAAALRNKPHAARKATSTHRKTHHNPRKVAPGAIRKGHGKSHRKTKSNPSRGLIRHNPGMGTVKEYALPLAVAVVGSIVVVAVADAAISNASWLSSLRDTATNKASMIGEAIPGALILAGGVAAMKLSKKQVIKDGGLIAVVLGTFLIGQKLLSGYASDKANGLFVSAPAVAVATPAGTVPVPLKGMSGGGYYTLADLQAAASAGASAAMKGLGGGQYNLVGQDAAPTPALSGYVMHGQTGYPPSALGSKVGFNQGLQQVALQGGLGALDNYAD